jgi:hypothetical protein
VNVYKVENQELLCFSSFEAQEILQNRIAKQNVNRKEKSFMPFNLLPSFTFLIRKFSIF